MNLGTHKTPGSVRFAKLRDPQNTRFLFSCNLREPQNTAVPFVRKFRHPQHTGGSCRPRALGPTKQKGVLSFSPVSLWTHKTQGCLSAVSRGTDKIQAYLSPVTFAMDLGQSFGAPLSGHRTHHPRADTYGIHVGRPWDSAWSGPGSAAILVQAALPGCKIVPRVPAVAGSRFQRPSRCLVPAVAVALPGSCCAPALLCWRAASSPAARPSSPRPLARRLAGARRGRG